MVYQKNRIDFERIASLATTRTYELTSSFRPSYNMAVNLVRNYTREEAHHLLNSSFAQFQADRGVVALERDLERRKAYAAGYREQMACHLGDFFEYWALRERARRIREQARRGAERARADTIRGAVSRLRPGDVIFVPTARRRGLAVVLGARDGKPTLLAQDRSFFRLNPRHFDEPPEPVTRIQLPRTGSPRSAKYRRDVAAKLVALDVRPRRQRRGPIDPQAAARADALEERASTHPCHACPDRPHHERWAARASKLEEEIDGLDRRIRTRTETLARQFERVLGVLQELAYVEGFQLQPKGEALSRIYGEGDILVAEALEARALTGISPAEFAALVSSVVYESRERVPRAGEMATAESARRYRELLDLWRRIRKAEDAHQVELCRELDAGFATTVFAWAEGKPLEDVLGETAMAPGDFVRSCKLMVDLLRQIEDVAGDDVAPLAHRAREAVNRGVVAYTGL